jgi:uncharacterized protein YkwD
MRSTTLVTRYTIVLIATAFAAVLAHADPLATVQMLRAGGCGGLVPIAKPLRRNPLLDRVAGQWAAGESLAAATADFGYRVAASGLHVSGSDGQIVQSLRHDGCHAISDRTLHEVGLYQRGNETWLVMISVAATAPAAALPPGPGTAQPNYLLPPPSSGGRVAPASPAAPRVAAPAAPAQGPTEISRALELVNQARARGARCGGDSYAPAPALTLSGTLGGVASGHALDMAQHNYFEHVDLSGHTPADRVRAVGYQEKLVGENIAYGPQTVEEVVRGWLDSPGHCANIMDPRFVEMGIAWAPGQLGRRGLYWVQVFAQPRV